MRAAWMLLTGALVVVCALPAAAESSPPAAKDLSARLAGIANLGMPSPALPIAAGWFLMGSTRVDDDPYGLHTQYDDTELPQHKVWLDAYAIDRDEVSLGEYLAHLSKQQRPTPDELRKLIWHMITVHAATDESLARWPALYVTWADADNFCRSIGKRLPTEAEWEKAARGESANLFPWGTQAPADRLAVFGQYHVHEIPLVQPVGSGETGASPYGARHMAGNVAEWVQDWFLFDYYAITPNRNPAGPRDGRYRGVRGGSWKSKPMMLRAATRSGAPPDQRAATVGFRCAASAPLSSPR
ncbi:MAG: formylglycine-generating enzyme family protein [Nitrospira sp.]|nr:formylglycine-generating enzyme family protein [Nitrospira sp.]